VCKEPQLRLSLTEPADHGNCAKARINDQVFGCHIHQSAGAQTVSSSPRELPPAGNPAQTELDSPLPTYVAISITLQLVNS